MTTLAISLLRTDALQALFIVVCGALAWRLIWAILVTPRLDKVPPLLNEADPVEDQPTVRVLLRKPGPEPDIRCIEVIDTRDALPSGPTEVITPRPVLPGGERRMVRRASR
ncbi:MAG: hypothetical protein IT432_04815 [Phycisphaerales bacterium]|nr:hypothetical protein [Phycisphaerales bacterium]